MKRRGLLGGGWGRISASSSALFVALALAPAAATMPIQAAAAAPTKVASPIAAVAAGSGTPELATYAGAPAAGKPTDVAQQPFGLAVFGRYTFVADPANHVVRLLLGSGELTVAGNGSLSAEGDGTDLSRSELVAPYAVAIGHVTLNGFQVTGFDIYIADTYGQQIRKVKISVPPIDSANGLQVTQICTIAGTGSFTPDGETTNRSKATFNSPYGLAWDDSRQLLYVADTLNNRIRAIHDPVLPPPPAPPPGTAPATVPCVPPLTAGTNPPDIQTVLGPGGLNHPRGLAIDSQGRLYIADTYNNVVRLYDPRLRSAAQRLTTLAGTGVAGYSGDGQAATAGRLQRPAGVAVDSQFNVYIADTGNNVIREVVHEASGNILHTVAGNGKRGLSGDGGPAVLGELASPMGVALRPNGDVVIADTGNNLVRILEGTLSNGPVHNIHTEAGNGTASFAGDGQPPAQAQFAGPMAVLSKLNPSSTANAAVPAVAGTRYVLDTFNQAVRTYVTSDADPDNHSTPDKDADDVSTLVGLGGVPGLPPQSGSQSAGDARFANPMGMALDAAGSTLYVADTFNNVIRQVNLANRNVTVFAGTAGTSGYSGDGDVASKATLSYPTGVTVDSAGDVFIADSYNGVVREVLASNKRIYTVAGTGQLGFSGDGGTATQAGLYFPYGVTVDGATPPTLFITDSFDHRIRRVDAVSPINPKNGKPFTSGAKNTITTVAGDGNEAFNDGAAVQPAGGSVTPARFDRPWSTTLDQGNLIVADYLNQRVRQVNLAAGTVSSIAGAGSAGLANPPTAPLPTNTGLPPGTGPALSGEIDGPHALSMLGDSGALLLADSFNNRIRWFGMTQAGIERTQVTFDPTNLAGRSASQNVSVTSTGSGLLMMGNVNLKIDADNFFLDPAKNACAQARLEPGSSCSFQVAFQPRSVGLHRGSVVIPNDAVGGQQLVALNGQATAALVGLSPPQLAIYQPVNGSATSGVVTLTNNGDGLLTIASIALQNGSAFGQSNNCPSVMVGHSSCEITITLNQIAPGDTNARSDTLVVQDDAAGSPVTSQLVPVTGSLAQPMTNFTRQSLTFTQNIGASSPPASFLLANNGQVPLHLSAIRDDGDFSQTNNCPPVLAPGASCTISVSFVPSTLGERDGYIVVADDSADSPQKIPVMGVATMPMVQLGANQVNLNANVGATAGPQSVAVFNRGDGPLTIGSIVATGDFKAQPHCPSVLPPASSCSIGVTFAPQAAGTRSGSLVLTDDSGATPGAQQSVRLSGFAYQPVASLSSTSYAPGANLGTSAPSQTVTVTNTGNGALTIHAVRIGGAAAGDYRQSTNCLTTIQPGGSCAITIGFTPHAYGVRAATLTLVDDGLGGSQSVALRGVGTAPRPLLSSGYLNFGGDSVGDRSAPQSVVLFNAGNGPLTINNIGLSGNDFVLSTTCGSSLGAGATCRITVTFLPQATGGRAGLVTISDSTGTQRVTLSGVGT